MERSVCHRSRNSRASVARLSCSAMLMCCVRLLYSCVRPGMRFTKSWISVMLASRLSRNCEYDCLMRMAFSCRYAPRASMLRSRISAKSASLALRDTGTLAPPAPPAPEGPADDGAAAPVASPPLDSSSPLPRMEASSFTRPESMPKNSSTRPSYVRGVVMGVHRSTSRSRSRMVSTSGRCGNTPGSSSCRMRSSFSATLRESAPLHLTLGTTP
mmetsp:Transcript_7133/g.24013  ORF Transcript_7133/g.24013 Transcript_7133/m.24013 type:complete len:214 (-) Transcript_7133:656-1297(-)